MSETSNSAIAVIGIDIGKNSFHIVGHDERGAIVLRQKWSRGQVEARFANMPPCLIGMEGGRDFAAWLGLVPRQMSNGDRTILGKISKRQSLPAGSVRAGGMGAHRATAALRILQKIRCHHGSTRHADLP